MPLSSYHVTASAGKNLFFGKDITDGWPIQQLVAQNGTFFYDPHSDNFQRLWIESASSSNYVVAGSGTINVSSATELGTQNVWFRQRSGIPGRNTNIA